MKLILAKNSGFCNGVNYTIKETLKLLEKGNVYCLGEIVHNERVIENLKEKGLIIVDNILSVPDNSKVIIRAHGEKKETYEIAKNHNIEVIDLTCGKIKIIKNKIKDKLSDYFIVIIGKHNHPETIGTISFSGKYSFIVENDSDLDDLQEKVKKSNLNKLYIVAQTTFSNSGFDQLVNKIKERFKNVDIMVDKTICLATENRQKEIEELANKVDKMIIVGSKHSSNANELFKIAKNNTKDVYLIDSKDDLVNIIFKENDIVGIASSASTSLDNVLEIVNYLENY